MLRKCFDLRLARRDLLGGMAMLAVPQAGHGELTLTKPASNLPSGMAGARLTFNEEFTHYAADADGERSWRTRYFHGDSSLTSNHEAQS